MKENIILDKSCRDILTNQWLHNTDDGKYILHQYKMKRISRQEYLDYVNKQIDTWLDILDSNSLLDFLSKQEFFEFNVDKKLSQFNDDNKALFLIEPIIVKRIDSSGNHHFLLTIIKESDDIIVKKLRFNPDNISNLLNKLNGCNYYFICINWFYKLDCPKTLIFGVEKDCKVLKSELEALYGINR